MKKLILFLLILSSAFASAQIQIPQVVGLPSALSSKATKAELDLKQTVFTGICQEQFLTENDIVIDNAALTLTIATVKNGQAISALNPICFYTDGNGVAVKHEKTAPVAFNFTNTDGVWYFYFDASGNPIATQTPYSNFSIMASVYRFYWNSTLTVANRDVIESIEFHKNDISWSDHQWKHSEGTKWLSGFNISHNSISSGTPNSNGSNAVISLSSGTNIDDNMEYTVTNASSGTVKFTQNLGTGTLPATSGKFICISNDASLRLQKIAATDFPFLWNPTTSIPQYLTSTGVRTDVGANNFFVYYVYALQDPRYGEAIKIKSAETDFSTSTLAAAHNWEQLQATFPTLRDGEIRLLYKLTFEYKSTFDVGTKKAALRVVDDLRKQKTTTTATAGGLLPATSVVVSPVGGIASTNAQSALQELDSEKQPVGIYSTDIHSNISALNAVSGPNTGDETLTSIKTKLGAATASSDGYLRYQDFALLHTPTTVTETNGLSISGQNISLQNASLTQSGALTFNDYNTFNSKQNELGSTQTTVLSNLTGINFNTIPKSTAGGYANSIATDNGTTFTIAGNLAANNLSGAITSGQVTTALGYTPWWSSNHPTTVSGYGITDIPTYGIPSLTTNSIPKWNGSSFVNSLIGDDGVRVLVSGNIWATDFKGRQINLSDGYGVNLATWQVGAVTSDRFYIYNSILGFDNLVISPTTGAATFARSVTAQSFHGSGSNLTGVQLPITLTTNGTSGAATKDGNNINIPNYSGSGSGGGYTAALGSIANVTGVSISGATYTLVGGIYTVSLRCQVTFTGATDCEVNVTLPATCSGIIKVFGGLASGGGQIYLGQSSTQTYASIGFKKPASVSTTWFDAIIIYQAQ